MDMTGDAGGRVSDEDLAGLFWDRSVKPGLVASGVPEDGLKGLRASYCRDAPVNPEAMRQIREQMKESS